MSRALDLQKAFANPAVPVTAKRAIVDKLLRQLNVTGPSAKLLLLLAERDRMAVLGDLVAAYRERLVDTAESFAPK